MRKILEDFLFAAASFFLLLIVSNSNAIVPVPAEDQSGPIAILGAVIHIGNGQVIGDGVITFDEGYYNGDRLAYQMVLIPPGIF